ASRGSGAVHRRGVLRCKQGVAALDRGSPERMPMRLVLVSQEYPPETARGGIGTQTHAKAHGLARLGHEVLVISHAPDELHREYDDGPVKVIRVTGYDRRAPMHTLETWWLAHSMSVAATLAAVHEQAPIDLVDFAEYGAEGFVWLLNRN